MFGCHWIVYWISDYNSINYHLKPVKLFLRFWFWNLFKFYQWKWVKNIFGAIKCAWRTRQKQTRRKYNITISRCLMFERSFDYCLMMFKTTRLIWFEPKNFDIRVRCWQDNDPRLSMLFLLLFFFSRLFFSTPTRNHLYAIRITRVHCKPRSTSHTQTHKHSKCVDALCCAVEELIIGSNPVVLSASLYQVLRGFRAYSINTFRSPGLDIMRR